MKSLRSIATCGLIWSILLHGAAVWATVAAQNRRVETVTTYSYTAGADEAPETANALAFFGAKYKAVTQTADQFVAAGLLNADANREIAIFCLVADAMPSRVIERSLDTDSRTYTVKIQSTLYPADFVKAEIRNEALDKAEKHFSLKEDLFVLHGPRGVPGAGYRIVFDCRHALRVGRGRPVLSSVRPEIGKLGRDQGFRKFIPQAYG
jgi:hypothetical protein